MSLTPEETQEQFLDINNVREKLVRGDQEAFDLLGALLTQNKMLSEVYRDYSEIEEEYNKNVFTTQEITEAMDEIEGTPPNQQDKRQSVKRDRADSPPPPR